MKWLEGWFGTLSGGLGALIVVIVSLVTPAYSQSQSCVSANGVTTCSSAYGPGMPPTPASGPQPAMLILLAITLLLFIGVLVGAWLDLSGRRTVGRLILLISVSLLVPAWLFDGPIMATAMGPGVGLAASGGAAFMFVLPLTLLAFVAAILACVRPDAPRPVAVTPAQTPISD
ncbi:MAG TPA: hypothetical protein VE338_17160 [Ktedonobacterales bacterium]|jgi:hypothetical protein|nr:hypothetical protein [Ktedonobacterales bacterium]